MININKNSKIYVLAPEGYETGGTELAHQLVDFLISKGSDAYIVYCNHARFVTAEVPPGFRKYNINVAPEPKDSSDNILVLPEINFNFYHFELSLIGDIILCINEFSLATATFQ